MSHDINFKTVAQTPILDVIEMLGIDGLKEITAEVKGQKTRQFVGTCPISKASNATAFKVTPAINRWVCFCATCKNQPKQGGDCVELVKRVKNIDHKAAAKLIVKGAGEAGGNPPPKQEAASPSAKPLDFDPLKYLASLDASHDALKSLDIMPETFLLFRSGYCAKGRNRGRLAVAWHDMSGNIRMFVGVSLSGDLPRYLAPNGQELPYWFNAHAVQEGEPVRILPSVLDVLRESENGATNIICPLREVDGLSLACLTAIVKDKKLNVEF